MKKIFFTTLIIFSFFLSISRFLLAAPICLTSEENKLANKTQIEEKVPDIKNEENEIIINEEKRTKETDEEDEIEISADKKIEVDKENGVMIATGNAFVKKGGTSLSADILTAFSCETTDGKMRIIQINADQNVVIKSDQGSAYANKGIYFVEKRIIELYENVKLEKDGDILVGDIGKFNVYTGKGEISVAPSNDGTRKKVYGIIKSKNK